MMNKLYFAVMSAVVVLLCLAGCRQTPSCQRGNTVSVGGLALDSIVYDSLKDNCLECKIVVGYPRGGDSLAMGIRKFIAGELALLYLPYNNLDEAADVRKFPLYDGSVDSGKQLVDHYGNGVMGYMAGLRDERKGICARGHMMSMLSQRITIGVDETNAAYVTCSVTEDNYLGGAHRSHTFYRRNISRKTNSPVDNTVSSGSLRDMQPLLRKNVSGCVKASGVDQATDSTLNDYLILPDDGLVPLPVHAPWLENDSLKFVYQQYEIASYAVGPIAFSIAVKEALPFLTKEAKALLGR